MEDKDAAHLCAWILQRGPLAEDLAHNYDLFHRIFADQHNFATASRDKDHQDMGC